MATGTYAPRPDFTLFDDSGNIVSGGKLYTYLAGTTTAEPTYSDVGLTTPNANPVVMDSAGRATVFLSQSVSYKFVAKTAADVTLWTRDNINPVPAYTSDVDITGTAGENLTAGECVYLSTGGGNDAARTAGRWYKADQTYSNRSSNAVVVGFATANITAAAAGTIRIGGRMTGLSALSVGANYCIDTTPGAIAVLVTNAGQRTVGRADSSTTLVMTFPAMIVSSATTHTDGTQVAGIVTTDAQTWTGLKTLLAGFKDSAYTAFLAADATNNTTTMSNLTGLTLTLVSGLKYAIELVLQMSNSTAADGMKIDFDGGAVTITDFRVGSLLTRETGAVVTLANGVSVALATDINVAAMASTSQHTLTVVGSIEPSSSATLIPRFAMNAATAGTLTVNRGSWLKLRVM